MKEKNSVIFLKDWAILVQSLPEKQQLIFWSLFSNYDFGKHQKCDDLMVFPIWNFISTQLDQMNQKYIDTIVERNRENGSKGGRPPVKKENPENPVGLFETQKTLNENEKDNDNENENKKGKKVFMPPAEYEVVDFFIENGFKKEVAKNAYAYYADGDWKDSKGKKVLNWKQKMRGVWFKDENKSDTDSGKKYKCEYVCANGSMTKIHTEHEIEEFTKSRYFKLRSKTLA